MKYKSDICEVVHEDAIAMYKVGAITEAEMKEFDEICLVKETKPAYELEKPAVMEHAVTINK